MADEERKVNPNYDFNAPIEKTSTEIAKFIISKLDEAKEFVIVENVDKLEPIAKAAFFEKSTDLSIEISKYMATTDIPADYATKSIDKVIVVLETLKAFIAGTINQYKDEMMARYLGAKSPKSGKYAAECATLGEVILKLEAIREEQGGNKYDYFSEPETASAPADAPDHSADKLSTPEAGATVAEEKVPE